MKWPWRKDPTAPARAEPVVRGEWRLLPPIERVLPAHPLVNPVQRFSDTLTSWQSPAYLAPLVHDVAPTEPSGVVEGLATPTAGPPMPLVPARPRKSRGPVLQRLLNFLPTTTTAPTSPTAKPEPANTPNPNQNGPPPQPIPHRPRPSRPLPPSPRNGRSHRRPLHHNRPDTTQPTQDHHAGTRNAPVRPTTR
nr:hypothetical protein GCM10017745_27540 [Saccharothrix mutabilis subsp. capreolus]